VAFARCCQAARSATRHDADSPTRTTPSARAVATDFPRPHLDGGTYPVQDGIEREGRALIHVLAIITTKPGQREAVLREFHANIPNVRAEQGCIEYGPTIDAEGVGAVQTPLGPDSFVVIEKWESLDALRAHGAAPHMKEYAARTKDMTASRVIHVLSPA
jgi:quinol monooxygenase YgiN